VSVGAAVFVGDELDAGNADVVRCEELLPVRDQRMVEIAHDLELVGRRRRGADFGERRRVDLAGVGRAELEARRGVDPHRVEELTPTNSTRVMKGCGALM